MDGRIDTVVRILNQVAIVQDSTGRVVFDAHVMLIQDAAKKRSKRNDQSCNA